jgi:hypothetical protein
MIIIHHFIKRNYKYDEEIHRNPIRSYKEGLSSIKRRENYFSANASSPDYKKKAEYKDV